MKKKATLREVHVLRNAIAACNSEEVAQTLRLFDKAEFTTASLIGYHDALLFLTAYPPSVDLFHEAQQRLSSFKSIIRSAKKSKRITAEQLINSGMNGTEVQGAFTLPLLNEIVNRHPANIELHSFGETDGDAGEWLKPYVLKTETDLCDGGYTMEELALKLLGKKNQLHRLVNMFSNSSVAESISEFHFSKLNVFATLKLNDTMPGRTSTRGLCEKVYTHSEFIRKADPRTFVDKPLPQASKLTEQERSQLRNSAMNMLASLSRETDPVTLSDDSAIEYYELERGVSVALFSTRASRRMPIDSYIGYMLYKNGVPLAYGGAWIFANRALFGINIFEPFRGGESNLIILQLLRVYRQHYGVDSFSVEPYQYGKDNPEGIASGAYWFYYKLGFRSDDMKLRALAESEMKRMQKNKAYRSPEKVLVHFTASNITWHVDPQRKIARDPASIAAAITHSILTKSKGDRVAHLTTLRNRAGISDTCCDTQLLLLEALNYSASDFGAKARKLSELKEKSEWAYNEELKST
jgi:hypothetical protein